MSLTLVAVGLALVLAAGLEWAARRGRAALPTFGDLCARVMAYRLGRVPAGRLAVVAFWWWIGWHFFAR